MGHRLLALMVVVLLLGGCSGAGDEQAVSTGATGPTPTAIEGASTTSVTVPSAIVPIALLTDIRVGRHEEYDRVVLTFANGVPGCDVRYVARPVIADGSGKEVSVEGTAVLRVRMEPALDADLESGSAPRTYTGPVRFSPDAAVISELVRAGGFEAVLVWAVGVDGERPFRVATLTDPPRVVIDVDSS